MDIVTKLEDLLKQATRERSHFYVGACITETLQHITVLNDRIKEEIDKNEELIQEIRSLGDELAELNGQFQEHMKERDGGN